MRGEGWTLVGGDGGMRGRERGGGRGKHEEKASVQALSYTTEFGWSLPSSEAKRQGLVNNAWLRDFSQDIEALQEEIRRQTASVYSNEETNCHENITGRYGHSEVTRQATSVHSEATGKHEDAARRESHSEIERLQWEVRRHPAFICRGERTKHNGDFSRTECHSVERCVAMKGKEEACCSPEIVKCEDRLRAAIMDASSREVAATSIIQTYVSDSSVMAVVKELTSETSNCEGSYRELKVKEERKAHCHNVVDSSESEASCDLDSGLSTFGDDAAKCDVYSNMQHKDKTQGSVGDEECCVSEESPFVLDSSLNTYTSGSTKCDAYSSMHSDVSRDSGIFTADDTSFLSEASGDLSLLQELGGVLSNQDVSFESCFHCGSLPLEKIQPEVNGGDGYTVWLKRFSSSQGSSTDLSTGSWGSHEWDVREDGEHSNKSQVCDSVSPVVPRQKNCGGEESDSNAMFLEGEKEAETGKQCNSCVKMNGGVKATQYRACQKSNVVVNAKQCPVCKFLNERVETEQRKDCENRNAIKDAQGEVCVTCKNFQQESPRSQPPPTQEASVMAKFCESFQIINKRVEDLRLGLDSLAGEVNRSKSEFMSLEDRATQLLASTASTRHRLKRVRILQLLEDRLQEEWWAAYDPGSVPFHENYIV